MIKDLKKIAIPIKITLEINFNLDLKDLEDENHLRKERGEKILSNLIELGAAWKGYIKANPDFILKNEIAKSRIKDINFGDYLIL